jgi:hypothetical protein
VLVISTIHEAYNAQNTVVRKRKRPTATLTSVKTAKKLFGLNYHPKLEIIEQVDDYNRKIGYVDQADQLIANDPCLVISDELDGMRFSSSCSISPLQTAILLSSVKTQDEFRMLFCKHLSRFGASTRKWKWVDYQLGEELYTASLKLDSRKSQEQVEHRRVHHGKRQECKECRLTGHTKAPNRVRILAKISLNTRYNQRSKGSY